MTSHISSITKLQAADALEVKILLLEKWLADGIPWKTADDGSVSRDENGECQLDFFPKNVSEFSLWDSTQNTGMARVDAEAISYTNRSTIYCTHKAKLAQIKNICRQLCILAIKQLKNANKTSTISNLHEECTLLRALSNVQANDITAAALELNSLQLDLERQGRELKNLRQRYDEETYQLKQRVAELTAILQKLTPLRKEEK